MLNGFRACWIVAVALGAVVAGGTSAEASARCDRLLARLADRVLNAADTTCFESVDLTTINPATTPADNSLTPPLPLFAFTPQTVRSVISPSPPNRTAITKKVPRVQRRLRMERLRRAARLRLCLPEQGYPQFLCRLAQQRDPTRAAGMPPQPGIDCLGPFLRQRSGHAVHPMDPHHDRGDPYRWKCGFGALWQPPAPYLRRWNIQWRISSAASARNRTRALRRRRRLGRHLRRSRCAKHP